MRVFKDSFTVNIYVTITICFLRIIKYVRAGKLWPKREAVQKVLLGFDGSSSPQPPLCLLVEYEYVTTRRRCWASVGV